MQTIQASGVHETPYSREKEKVSLEKSKKIKIRIKNKKKITPLRSGLGTKWNSQSTQQNKKSESETAAEIGNLDYITYYILYYTLRI